jgi:pantetheine-phosphate adenylyltransferase
MNYKIGVYPGTFDPITNGHLDIIKRAAKIFDTLIVGVAENSEKNTKFTAIERKKMIDEVLKTEKLKNVKAEVFSGLLINFANSLQAGVLVRGLRAVSDFEYEFQMACVNNKLAPKIETIFLPSSDDMHFISSRFVKSIGNLGGDISKFVPSNVVQKLEKIYKK